MLITTNIFYPTPNEIMGKKSEEGLILSDAIKLIGFHFNKS